MDPWEWTLHGHWPPFPLTRPLVSPPQNLVEAAEEADLNHEFNESLVVSPPAPTALGGTTTNILKSFDPGPLRTGHKAGVEGKRPSIVFQCMQVCVNLRVGSEPHWCE